MAKTLKWFFETTKNTLSGANDPIHETFRANPYYSIVRESIQNSMDVRLDDSKPVEVRFEVITINQAEHEQLFSLKTHIESCLEFHKGNKQAEDLYTGMLKYLDENPAVKILKVSDYNTKGMHYDSNDHLCPFTSFMGEGISSKSSGSGGSFGFGKGAYYVPSELRTILVSTMIENGEVFFQGRTRLASHKINGETRGKDGVFKIEEEHPVTDVNDISIMFRRATQGTDVYILGMRDDPQCGREMVKSVLNNFWLAVHEDRLDVGIKTDDVNVRFDETNLEDIMNEYFPDDVEQGPIGEIYQWNPKAYYKSVKYAGQSKDYLLFENELPALGPVRLYVYRKDGLQNRLSFMRKPAMTVFKTGRTTLSGYAAVFVCDNEDGNEVLRQMENAAHNEWKPENVRYVPKENMQIYHDAKHQINEYVRETLKSISGLNSSSKIEVIGLSDFLSIPEELLDDEEAVPGIAASTREGISSDNKTADETGLITTSNTSFKVKARPTSLGSVSSSADESEGDDIVIKGGRDKNDENNPNPNPSPSAEPGAEIEEGTTTISGEAKAYIPVRFRVAATNLPGGLFHNLILNSPEDYSKVFIDLKAGTDNGEETELIIAEVDQGNIHQSGISGITLKKGKNVISVRFNDNIKYTLKLNAYEAQ
jgi:hypothetical protein